MDDENKKADDAQKARLDRVWRDLVEWNHELRKGVGRDHIVHQYIDATLKRYPAIWDRMTSVQREVERELAAVVAQGDALLEKKTIHDLGQLKDSFPLRNAGCPLGRVLVDQIVLAELAAKLALQRMSRLIPGSAPKLVKANQRFYETANRNLSKAIAEFEVYRTKRKAKKRKAPASSSV